MIKKYVTLVGNRWEVVAEYINQHSLTSVVRQAKEVLSKAKELQHSDQHMREVANKSAYANMEKSQQRPGISDATASQRYDSKKTCVYTAVCLYVCFNLSWQLWANSL